MQGPYFLNYDQKLTEIVQNKWTGRGGDALGKEKGRKEKQNEEEEKEEEEEEEDDEDEGEEE